MYDEASIIYIYIYIWKSLPFLFNDEIVHLKAVKFKISSKYDF